MIHGLLSIKTNDYNKEHYRNCECFLLEAGCSTHSSTVRLADR